LAGKALNILKEILPQEGIPAFKVDPMLELPEDKLILAKEIWRDSINHQL